MSIKNIEQHKEDILKAELLSYFMLMEKTKLEWWKNKDYFTSLIPDNTSYPDLNTIAGIFSNLNIKLDFGPNFQLSVNAAEFLNDNWRSWRRVNLQNDTNKILQVLYGVGESLNSGIDKGSPNKQLENNVLWISNAFGSYTNAVSNKDYFDKKRDELINKIQKGADIKTLIWEVRDLMKDWLKNLLADTRYPVNDITLWEQTYMPSTMFKATLAGLYYSQDFDPDNFKHSDIRWSILGIQYDKLGLAEKPLKIGNIQWYREAVQEIDTELKRFFEIDFPVANEVYRDETGIYFLISEKFLDNSTKLKIKKEIEDKVFKIFEDKLEKELYPYIALTEPSRGLMNLTTLLENASQNFLKAQRSNVPKLEIKDFAHARGVCSVCGMRLATKTQGTGDSLADEEKLICETCLKRKKYRVDQWIDNLEKETIWTGELKDQNDRIALITLKFELNDWLSGNMLSTLTENALSNYQDYYQLMKETLLVIKDFKQKGAFDINYFNSEQEFLDIERILTRQVNGIAISFETLEKNYDKNQNGFINRKISRRQRIEFDFISNSLKVQGTNSQLNNNQFNDYKQKVSEFVKKYSFTVFRELAKDAYNGVKSIDALFNQIFFATIRGTKWYEFVEFLFHDFNNKFDFANNIIHWNNLDNKDIEVLTRILLQFLLRKNTSPARLFRIWNNTKEFFEDIKNNIQCITGKRQRYIWQLSPEEKRQLNGKNKIYLYYGNLQFWYQDGKIYQIYEAKLPEDKDITLTDENGSPIISHLSISNAEVKKYIPYFSIIEPTPVSWQFIIPADKVPALIDYVDNFYKEQFHWVYGKLPLHIGIVFQDYKKPLYVGVKALRQIRRDGFKYNDLKKQLPKDKCEKIFDDDLRKYKEKPEETKNNAEKYYSLFIGDNGEYEFYFPPDHSPKKLATLDNPNVNVNEVSIFPNTFDFEFMDTNARRNDLYYLSDNGVRRSNELKNQRPYTLEYWQKFKIFGELFDKDNQQARSSRLQKLITLIYAELDKKRLDIDYKISSDFLYSAFVNILQLNKDEKLRKGIFEIFDIEQEKELKNLKDYLNQESLKFFLDLFAFWHTALKQV